MHSLEQRNQYKTIRCHKLLHICLFHDYWLLCNMHEIYKIAIMHNNETNIESLHTEQQQ